MKKILRHPQLLILLVLGLVAFIRCVFYLEPDFGWHLRMGQIILSHGIPATDPFSYTMPSYPAIDHEWLSNVLIAIFYKSVGFVGLSLIFTALYITSLIIIIPKKFKNFSLVPLLLAGSLMLQFVEVRPQVITLFFISILLKIIFDENLWKKWRYILPLIFIPWANLHGGFSIGIVLLLVFFLAKTIEKRRLNFESFKVFLVSLVLTFINPYGPRIWWEVWMTASDNSLRWIIEEWMPAFTQPEIAVIILFALSICFVFFYRKKLNFSKIAIFSFLSLMAISSVRHILLWALSAIIITSEAFFFLKKEVGNNKENLKRLNIVKKILIPILLLVFLYEILNSLVQTYSLSEQQYYPVQAVKFLSQQKFQGNLLTSYNFAGYILWKIPGKKDFIDGRMPSWRRSGVYPNESNYAFKDYQKMGANENFAKQMLIKYDIHYVLLSRPEPIVKVQPEFVKKFNNFFYHLINVDPNSADINWNISKLGLKEIYNDEKFIIYKK